MRPRAEGRGAFNLALAQTIIDGRVRARFIGTSPDERDDPRAYTFPRPSAPSCAAPCSTRPRRPTSSTPPSPRLPRSRAGRTTWGGPENVVFDDLEAALRFARSRGWL